MVFDPLKEFNLEKGHDNSFVASSAAALFGSEDSFSDHYNGFNSKTVLTDSKEETKLPDNERF